MGITENVGTLANATTCILCPFITLMSPPLLAQSATQPKSSKPTATPTAFDQATLVILTSGGPVLADLRISVAKIPIEHGLGSFWLNRWT